jgi:hypothetical protein
MTLGTFTRASLEADAGQLAEQLFSTFAQLERLRGRAQAELAAGTLDGTEFYQASPNDKAHILAFLDDMHDVYSAVNGAPLVTKDYTANAKYLF